MCHQLHMPSPVQSYLGHLLSKTHWALEAPFCPLTVLLTQLPYPTRKWQCLRHLSLDVSASHLHQNWCWRRRFLGLSQTCLLDPNLWGTCLTPSEVQETLSFQLKPQQLVSAGLVPSFFRTSGSTEDRGCFSRVMVNNESCSSTCMHTNFS